MKVGWGRCQRLVGNFDIEIKEVVATFSTTLEETGR